MPIRKNVTLKTIAKEAGVTVQTVIKALKGKPGLSESTRRLIVQTAERLGYYTREQIRSLKLEHIEPFPMERLRFLLVHTQESIGSIRPLLKGLHDRFASFGHRIEPVLLPGGIREQAMEEWIDENGLAYADGIFIAPSITPRAWEPHLFRLGLPRILLNFPPPGIRIDSVIWDVYEAAYQAAAYLIGQGHRRLMYVGDIHSQRGYLLRWQAFCHALDAHGLPVNPAEHSISERLDRGAWVRELRLLLERHRPSAVVCGVHHEVEEVFRICGEMGLTVPGDLSFIGFLNEQPSGLPVFTRPMLPVRETGYRAADRMLWRIANPTLPYEHIRIQGELRIGETTGLYQADLEALTDDGPPDEHNQGGTDHV